jgi:D-lactate dehydrogenase (cytochrome)
MTHTADPAGRLAQAVARIRAVLGEAGCVTDPAGVEPYLVDFRHLYRGATSLVALPSTTAEVSAVLAICNELGIGVVPHGGNTSYCGGATPHATGDEIVVALRRLNRIRELDAANYSLIAEAGCVLAEVQRAAESVDRLFPLALGSEGSCQIGGNLSTNAGGLAAVKYGLARDLVLGLEVVLADGRVLDGLKSLRKDNTGYDLRHVFIGAEGTLGIITAASLKLLPRPRTIETLFVAVDEPAAALELLARLKVASGDDVTTFELVPRLAVELVCEHVSGIADPMDRAYPWYVLCEVSSSRNDPSLRAAIETELETALSDGLVVDAVFATSGPQRDGLWRLRESIPEAQRRAGASLKHDIAVPVASVPAFIARASAAVLAVAPDARLVTYGHAGDGNLHFNLSVARGGDSARFLAHGRDVEQAVFETVRAFGGSISAEHGIGQLKLEQLKNHKSAVALDVMRRIKDALDPNGIMNPGKVLTDR